MLLSRYVRSCDIQGKRIRWRCSAQASWQAPAQERYVDLHDVYIPLPFTRLKVDTLEQIPFSVVSRLVRMC